MKIHARENLVKAGLCKCKNGCDIDIEKLAQDVLRMIQESQDGYDQRQLLRDLREQGWEEVDIHLALGLLQRRNKIVYMTD